MWADVLAALRREFSAFDVVASLLILAAVYLFTDEIALTLGIFTGLLLVHAVDTLRPVPDVDERWLKVVLGLFVTGGGGVMLWLELADPRDAALSLLFVLGGLWILLDARADFLQGRRLDTAAAEDLDSGEAMLVMQHLRLVADALEDGPKTVPELAAACDLTESRIRQAIDVVSDDGTIYQVDGDDEQPRYALDERKLGITGLGRMAAGGVRGLAHRVVRPFRVQF